MGNKTRLDVLLVERGFAPTRQKAQAIIMAGSVFVAGQRVDKPAPPSRTKRSSRCAATRCATSAAAG